MMMITMMMITMIMKLLETSTVWSYLSPVTTWTHLMNRKIFFFSNRANCKRENRKKLSESEIHSVGTEIEGAEALPLTTHVSAEAWITI